jgi:2,4-didehydro-3-deoxy-L-rhamnonate hydrolase
VRWLDTAFLAVWRLIEVLIGQRDMEAAGSSEPGAVAIELPARKAVSSHRTPKGLVCMRCREKSGSKSAQRAPGTPKGCPGVRERFQEAQLRGPTYRGPERFFGSQGAARGRRGTMRLCTYEDGGRERVGVEKDGGLVDLSDQFGSMIELIRGGEAALAGVRRAMAAGTPSVPMGGVRLLAPIPRPGKILCSGLNYHSHIEENPEAKFLEDPRFFAKVPSVVIGPGEPIRHPGMEFQVDYEVELAVVIGRTMSRAAPDAVMEHVFGYTVFHDVSARAIQFKDNNETMGKNFDTFAPMGPCLVTADEIPDPRSLRLRLWLNGEVMQDRTNEDWIFPLPRLLAWLSGAMTLEPGDVVTTGTPAGVGFFRRPQVFLKPGDTCVLEIDRIGWLENPVVARVGT